MDGDQLGRLIYLVLLGAVVGGYFMVEGRKRLGKVAQQAAIWGLIFVGMMAGYGLWSDIRSTGPRQQVYATEGRIEVPRSPDGHYHLTMQINGTAIPFVVDTGATNMVLTRADAARVGIDTDSLAFIGQANTANGTVRTAPVRLDSVEIGPFRDSGVRAWVNGGEMDGSLLGMSYLQRFSSVEFAGGRLILTR
ncbi:retropepsin-like aspartic protease family protein [Actibacterium ureilyticum]|uniref:retropepsin-like aspartic protease family protein n=1 Tax=Actibacterium ureilyticum TaxID=1590614 RepID=UPI000BAAB096|nr:TIGR02281 family clan AA aspartic protease [Actibacterium ureilyticum]